jgi:hypothetical protein
MKREERKERKKERRKGKEKEKERNMVVRKFSHGQVWEKCIWY